MKPTSSSAISVTKRRGPVVKISEVLGPDRLRVGTEHGVQSLVLQRGDLLLKEKLKAGDEVRTDSNYKIAIEVARAAAFRRILPRLRARAAVGKSGRPAGGACGHSRCHRAAAAAPGFVPSASSTQTPKGFLLHGPPGCGKTLIGKATAYNLTQQLKEQTGEEMREYFMHIKGPEILNMWVGESERMVREIFATAREKRREGYLPFLFIDEAESILGTRRASRYSNILSTLVPMFCTEMDGIESLAEVVIILASQSRRSYRPGHPAPRPDRPEDQGAPGPTREGAHGDLPHLPRAEPALRSCALVKEAGEHPRVPSMLLDRQRSSTSQFRPSRREQISLSITLRSGKKETLYPRRPHQRRDHRLDRRARERSHHQARDLERRGGRYQRGGFAS